MHTSGLGQAVVAAGVRGLLRTLAVWVAVVAMMSTLLACSGVQLRSVPRLMKLSDQLLHANPADVMVALQVDDRLTPPTNEVPQLLIQVTPKDPKAYSPIDRKLPLQLTVADGGTLGLEAPPRHRRWLIYNLTPASQTELARIQAMIRQAQNQQGGEKKGGTLSLGIEQASMAQAVTDTALAQTRWETWFQASRAEGFFEVWSGTTADVAASAPKNR